MAIHKHIEDNISIPVIGAPLFLVSGPDLVIAQCKAGIIGSFPALNARPQHVLEEWIIRIKTELAQYQEENPDAKVAPFAVNQICHGSNDRLMQDMETCVKHEVPIIITSLRPPAEVVEAAHSYGGLVYHDVISVRHAKKAAEQGVDGLILVCAGAGGHAGALSPFALLREVKKWFDGTVILSGSIGDGHAVASAIALGADFAYLGTRFIATEEANADPEYKRMLEASAAEDIVYSSLFTGVHGNYLKPSIKNAPSNKAVIGRYILPKTIFKKLLHLKPGKGGEIHITDAIQSLINENEKFIAHNFAGKYLDCGTMSGFIKSNIEIGKL